MFMSCMNESNLIVLGAYTGVYQCFLNPQSESTKYKFIPPPTPSRKLDWFNTSFIQQFLILLYKVNFASKPLDKRRGNFFYKNYKRS